MDLQQFIDDFAWGLAEADSRSPTAVNQRNGQPFSPGIGPHTEARTVSLVMSTLSNSFPDRYQDRYLEGVPYPNSRQKCDLCFGDSQPFDMAVEVKMIRLWETMANQTITL